MAADADFLGRGWAFPPRFAAGGAELAMVTGETDIEQSLGLLLATRRGERLLQDDFGCELSEFLFSEISQSLLGRVRELITGAILAHEPRIRLIKVVVSERHADEGLLMISIEYIVRATNSRYNLVYPFYLREAAHPPGAGGGAL